jgi:PAS domain S-box-containing protein
MTCSPADASFPASHPGLAAALLAGVLDSAMDAIITADEQQKVVLYNRAAERLFGWPWQEVMGQPLDRLIPDRLRQAHARHVERFGRTGETSRRMGARTVVYGLRSNGLEFPLEASISWHDSGEGKLFTVILRDVTEQIRLQEERDALAAAAHGIREEEKARVARELHDELAQSLTALKMDTLWVRDNAATWPEAASAKLTDMLEMLDRAVASTRRIAADLRPMLLDDLGLVAAIEWLASNFTQRCGVACKLVLDEQLQLPEPYATAVFRIVQESLANVAKHAGASQVGVAVDKASGAINLTVLDNGRGFSTAAARQPNALGLLGLRERVQLLKGSVLIESAPGEGTRIGVRIPLPQTGAQAGAQT